MMQGVLVLLNRMRHRFILSIHVAENHMYATNDDCLLGFSQVYAMSELLQLAYPDTQVLQRSPANLVSIMTVTFSYRSNYQKSAQMP